MNSSPSRSPLPARLVALASCLLTALPGVAFAQAGHTVQVTVNAAHALAPVTSLSLGVNTSVYDGHLADPQVPGLVRAIGMTVMRYPGGTTSDTYHWRTNTDTKGYAYPAGDDFDHFMRIARASGATPLITVNYGTNAAGTGGGDPAEAAAWVDYADNVKHYGVEYWEIGNEVYGNGLYGGAWEPDYHAGPDLKGDARKAAVLLQPSVYGANVAAYAAAMKAKDPRIKIGAVLIIPKQWPDGFGPDWNGDVLKACGRDIDFVIIHDYPENAGQESDAKLLASTADIATVVPKVNAVVRAALGHTLPVWITETNSVASAPGKQSVSLVNALFAADDALTFLTSGAVNVDWWQLHNGASTGNNNDATLYGSAGYGDYGVLSDASGPEPPADTPQPTYYGLQMAHRLIAPGDKIVAASSSDPLVAVHAARTPTGGLRVMLINKDPDHAATVHVALAGAPKHAATGTRADYGTATGGAVVTKAVAVSRSGLSVTVPAYTITVVSVAR